MDAYLTIYNCPTTKSVGKVPTNREGEDLKSHLQMRENGTRIEKYPYSIWSTPKPVLFYKKKKNSTLFPFEK